MNQAALSYKHRGWYCLLLLPLIVAASLALLRYAGWAAVYSGNHGLPSKAGLLKEASDKANASWWLLMGLAAASILVATLLIPPLTSEKLSPGIRGIGRFVLALGLVVASIPIGAIAIVALEHYFR